MTTLKGLDKVMRNLNIEIEKIKGRSEQGLLAVGLFIKGEAQEITPVEKGVLVNSSFVDLDKQPKGPVVRVGYTAEYAAKVHEFPEDFNYTKPGTGPKFLEKTVDANQATILKVIKNRAKF